MNTHVLIGAVCFTVGACKSMLNEETGPSPDAGRGIGGAAGSVGAGGVGGYSPAGIAGPRTSSTSARR